MELLKIENLSFTYPKATQKALDEVSLSLERGSFSLLCGRSGCGKSTLLRLIKRELAPYGEKSGAIFYCGAALEALEPRISAGEIGFVAQNPEEQIVTDKVWHELAFGLENLGVEQLDIRRRVGEMASYFGIQDWYHRDTDALSGGQKQLLNLAAVMAMQPKLLLLDEPTGQLDPIAAADFIATLQRLNRELGLTIVLAEHRLEEVFPIADQVIVMDGGKLLYVAPPRAAAAALKGHPLEQGLPSACRIWSGLGAPPPCPLTVREGREFLEAGYRCRKGAQVQPAEREPGPPVLEAEHVWFRYERQSADVLRDMSLSVRRGEIFSILGRNGTGKTTTLGVLAGLDRPYRGKVLVSGRKISDYRGPSLYRRRLALLPQNPKTVFLKPTVGEDLEEMLQAMDVPRSDWAGRMEALVLRLGIGDFLDRHPYDLSGGEQQKCALCKLLCTEPELLLLDEPTKGLDAFYKSQFAKLLLELKDQGKTILLVTHDVEFAAEVSDRCALFFDGQIISQGEPNRFFAANNFYTTAASRISRTLFPNAVLCRDVVALCKGELG